MRPAHSTHLTRELPLAGVDVDALQLVVVPASPDQQVLVSPTILGRREPDSSVGKIRYGLYRDEVLLAEGILPVGTQESPSVPISFPVADTPATVDRVTYTLRLRNTEDSGDTYASQGLSLHVEPVSGALEFVGERRGRIAATPDTPVVTIDRTGTSLDVGWSSSGATEYRYRERYGSTTGDWVVTTGDSVTLTNRVRRRTYHYDVQARIRNSPWSATGTESVTIPGSGTPPPPPPPEPPTPSVTIVKTPTGYIATLSWDAVSDASSYEYQGEWQDGSTVSGTTSGTSVRVQTGKHVCTETIRFEGEVRTVGSSGKKSEPGSESASVSNTHPVPVPSSVGATIAKTSAGYEATLSWGAVAEASGYECRGAWQGESLPDWSACAGTSKEFPTGKHVCDATITFTGEVRAVCSSGRKSLEGRAAGLRTNDFPVPVPSPVSVTIAKTSTGYSTMLSWDAIEGVPKYEYRGAWQGASLPNTWSFPTRTSVEFTTGKHVCDEDIAFEGEVRAVCSATKKGPAGSASATRTGVGPDAPPVTVSPIAETYDGDGRVDGYTTHMSWPAVDGVTTYEYQYTWQSGAYSEWMSTTLRSVEFTTGKHSGAGVIYFNGKVRSVCTATLKSTATSASDSYVVPPPDPPGQNPTPETQAPPTTRPPTTRPPTTRPPTTRPPTTRPPTTRPPTTRPPTTRPPTTRPPTTRPPVTQPPTTQPPTVPPPTLPPWRPPWITLPPTTRPPTTRPPTTRPPVTQAPTTRPPTTRPPVTQAPTTQPPTEPPGPPDPNELGGW